MNWNTPKINEYLATKVMDWPVVEFDIKHYKSGKDLGHAIPVEDYAPCEDFDLAIKAFKKVSGPNLLFLYQGDYVEGQDVWCAACHYEDGELYGPEAESPALAICLVTLAMTEESLEEYKVAENEREGT